MDQGLLLSVVIPIYNGSQTISRCLDTLLTVPDATSRLEIILVNDGSTDDTVSVVEQYKATHSEVSISLLSQANQGQSVARNKGLEQAQGAYVWFVDADDWIDSETADYLLNLVTDDPYDMLCFGVRNVADSSERGVAVASWQDTSVSDFDQLQHTDGVSLLTQYELSGSVCPFLWRRDFLKAHHAHFLEGLIHEDTLFYCHYTAYAERVLLVPKVGYYYYQRGDSTIHNPDTLHLRAISRIEGAFRLLDCADELTHLRDFYLYKASEFYRLGLRILARHGKLSELVSYTRRMEQTGQHKLLVQYAGRKGRPLLYLGHHAPRLFRLVAHLLPAVG